jgi:hypothetical protein
MLYTAFELSGEDMPTDRPAMNELLPAGEW